MFKAFNISIILLLFSLSIEEIPQDQKDLCQRVAYDYNDCLVELDDSYFCCYAKAKTVEGDYGANLCAVIEAKEINKRVIKEILKDFAPFLEDVIFNDVGLMTAFSIFYNLIESGLKETDLVCPIDAGSKKGRIITGVSIGIVAILVIGVICCCCKKDSGNK